MADEHLTSLQPGTVIGGTYEVVKCLGAGSMGMVYACRHRELQGNLVAAKVLFHEVASDKVASARFKNEILASYGISHPNVVRAYEFIRDGDLVAYTMEYVGGGDLADRMCAHELMSIPDCIKLLLQMAAGVQAIHDSGIVHRDLKPENILLTKENNVKIADFGIARTKHGPKLTEHGGVVGTIEYVAPEYMLRSQVDWRSDIYALGILAFELLTGEAPFKGDSPYDAITKRLQSEADPPSKYRIECPKEVDAVILRALEKDPEQRYQSATDLFYDLIDAAKDANIEGVTTSGILIPSRPAPDAPRYVGPRLNNDKATESEQVETQLLTSDGSIEYSASRPSVEGGSDYDEEMRSASRGRQDTEVLGPVEMDYSDDFDDSVESYTGPQADVALDDAVDPMVQYRESMRAHFREQYSGRDSVGEFPTDLLERSSRRLLMLDGIIFAVAAVSGIGIGYLFLRLFAPSFLDKFSGLGIGL
jgi:serine/threonine protein kinase